MTMKAQQQIILFRVEKCNWSTSKLKHFLHLLKVQKVRAPAFHYVSIGPKKVADYTLDQWLLWRTFPNQWNKNPMQTWDRRRRELNNPHLNEMIKTLPPMKSPCREMSLAQLKLAALIRGLIAPCDFLFLDSPELYLDGQQKALFLKALEVHLSRDNAPHLIAAPTELQEWKIFSNIQWANLTTRGYLLHNIDNSQNEDTILLPFAA